MFNSLSFQYLLSIAHDNTLLSQFFIDKNGNSQTEPNTTKMQCGSIKVKPQTDNGRDREDRKHKIFKNIVPAFVLTFLDVKMHKDREINRSKRNKCTEANQTDHRCQIQQHGSHGNRANNQNGIQWCTESGIKTAKNLFVENTVFTHNMNQSRGTGVGCQT